MMQNAFIEHLFLGLFQRGEHVAGKHAGTAQAVIGADGMREQSHPSCLGEQGGGSLLSIAVTEPCEKPAWRGKGCFGSWLQPTIA